MMTPTMTSTDDDEIETQNNESNLVVKTPKLDEYKFSSHTMSLMKTATHNRMKRHLSKENDLNDFNSPCLSGSEADDSVLSVKFTPVISSATKSLLNRTMNKAKIDSSDTKSTGRDSIESSCSLDTPRMDKEMLPTRTPMLPPMDENGRVVKTCKKNGKIVRESIGSVSSVDTPVLDEDDLPTRTPMLPPMKATQDDDDDDEMTKEITKKMKGMEVYEEEEDDDEAMMDSEEDETEEEEEESSKGGEKKSPVHAVEEAEYTKMPKYLRWQVTKSSLDAVIDAINAKFEVDEVVTKDAVHEIVVTLNIEKLKSTSVILMLCKLNRFVIVSKGKY
eukprot:g2255.t1